MCTIMTFTPREFVKGMYTQIEKDFKDNPHGSVLMIADKSGALIESIRTMNIETVLDAIDNAKKWSRVFIHQRYATQGQKAVNNIHGWQYGQTFWMHNGTLYDPRAARFPVDSQLIGHWIAEQGVAGTARHIADAEYFANVILVDNAEKSYWVSRGGGGTLYTDNRGNFSTNPVNGICIELPEGYAQFDTKNGKSLVWGFVETRASQLPPEVLKEEKKTVEIEEEIGTTIDVKRVAEMTDEEYAIYMRRQWNKDTAA